MTMITLLNKENTAIGPFTRAQVEQKLKAGECSLSDLAFTEGLTQWTPLGQVLARVDAVALPAAPAFVPPAVPVAGAPVYSYAASMQPSGHVIYAGFWLRFVAYILDRLIVGIPLVILNACEDLIFGFEHPGQRLRVIDYSHHINTSFATLMGSQVAFSVLVYWLYFALLESGSAQATFGKRILGLKVTDLVGNRIGFGQATGRFFGKVLSALILFIGFIMAGFTERKQALHDMLAGTLVVKGQ